ncbi:MAG: esterase-like activity of phytase family protein [Prevotella sp.]|nr:esterase-like activity of phytase family protein [Prevotella sp.]
MFFLSSFIFHLSSFIFLVEHPQHTFPEDIPPGGYSGITWLGDSLYAVVADNMPQDGFFRFSIQLDSLGDIVSARCIDFMNSGIQGRDSEGVAWCDERGTVFVSGERDNQVLEFQMDGKPTGKKLHLPEIFNTATKSYGIEALTYNAHTHRFWTTTESTLPIDGPQATATNGVENKLRMLSFNDSLRQVEQFFYVMDSPQSEVQTKHFSHGVSALAAMDDGRLLVLEREFAVPEEIIGACVNCKIYVVEPSKMHPSCNVAETPTLPKTLLAEWTTAIGLLDFSIANYEGMCLGPKLPNGGQVILLISDSQNQYAGILQDWLKTLVIY